LAGRPAVTRQRAIHPAYLRLNVQILKVDPSPNLRFALLYPTAIRSVSKGSD
jgi:hypothetical protein